ncbi:heparinase [Pseudolabrys taiwanensis]|uniref:Heparinase n=1 Tax=Pseudolabrys taiwanensis TaxID=331696 RepID=A0A345ZZY8_9HYPH|nr:heparinase II/III family protein [Pseudolabrys taiwanensis]AXK82485.1 heparinase [Pseudolabrys taiwanensis]
MVAITVAERARLSALIGRRAFRSLLGRVNAHPLLRWRFGSTKTDRLVIAPQDLRTADATRAAEIYSGRFAFAGKVVICDRRSPFEMTPPSDEWAVVLLSFAWLRHLRAADSAITRANARALIDDWINQQGGWHPVGWRLDILSRRVICWLSQAPFVLQDADPRFYRRFIRSLSRQVRYLRRTLKETRDGLPRLQAIIALNYAALCIQGQSGGLRGHARRLIDELRMQILPDGGHISRNPGALIELLADLLPLRQLFSARNLQPPQALNNAIDRMMPMLRFFRHPDGNFGQFNGMGPTPVDLLATVLAYDDTRGAPLSYAPHSAFHRIDANNTVMLMDTGRPPPVGVSQEAHAGCLSFELSWKQQRLVINCGLPAVNKENWRQVARQTAAHSTGTLNDKSSCRFLESGTARKLLSGTPIVAGPRDVRSERDENAEGTLLRASHDGYVDDFGIVHTRTIRLSQDGRLLDGEDSFAPPDGRALSVNVGDEYAVRFHLHPAVKANRLSDGRGVILLLPDKEVWTFATMAESVQLEESVYLAGTDGPRRTVQIVIYGHARSEPTVRWSFRHTPPAPSGGRIERADEPELPL